MSEERDPSAVQVVRTGDPKEFRRVRGAAVLLKNANVDVEVDVDVYIGRCAAYSDGGGGGQDRVHLHD